MTFLEAFLIGFAVCAFHGFALWMFGVFSSRIIIKAIFGRDQ